MPDILYNDFTKVEIRVGTIIEVEDFPEARKPSYKLKIDFGKLGINKSSAQVCDLYKKEELLGKQVVCIMNLGKKQIGSFMSEVLTTGFDMKDGDKRIALATVDKKVENGMRLY